MPYVYAICSGSVDDISDAVAAVVVVGAAADVASLLLVLDHSTRPLLPHDDDDIVGIKAETTPRNAGSDLLDTDE
jgi:hypothetical protein